MIHFWLLPGEALTSLQSPVLSCSHELGMNGCIGWIRVEYLRLFRIISIGLPKATSRTPSNHKSNWKSWADCAVRGKCGHFSSAQSSPSWCLWALSEQIYVHLFSAVRRVCGQCLLETERSPIDGPRGFSQASENKFCIVCWRHHQD